MRRIISEEIKQNPIPLKKKRGRKPKESSSAKQVYVKKEKPFTVLNAFRLDVEFKAYLLQAYGAKAIKRCVEYYHTKRDEPSDLKAFFIENCERYKKKYEAQENGTSDHHK